MDVNGCKCVRHSCPAYPLHCGNLPHYKGIRTLSYSSMGGVGAGVLPTIHQSNECTENICFKMSIVRRQEVGKVTPLSGVKPEGPAEELLPQHFGG